MNLVSGYDSDEGVEQQPQKSILVAPVSTIAINPNPEVSTAEIEAKVFEEQQKKIDKYSRTEKLNNHLSGSVETWHMNDFSFNEQYHNFTKYGIAMDPTAQTNKLIVTSNAETGRPEATHLQAKDVKFVDPNDPEYAAKSVFGLHTKEEIEKKKELAKKRKRFGDASSGDFLGPWASYDGKNCIENLPLLKNLIGEEEMNIDQNLELDEQRKEILSAIEEKRKKKLEEKKEQEAKAVCLFPKFPISYPINRWKFNQFSMEKKPTITKEEAIFYLLLI